jgi:formate hydrogenlyase transcriptional activator
MVNLPLLAQGRCIGTLNLGSVQSGEPTPEDLEFLRHLATQIAISVDNVRAYEQINRLRQQLVQEETSLPGETHHGQQFSAMLMGESASFLQALALADRVGPTTSTVLVTGETGTGKELFARAVHDGSTRRTKPFVRVNCSALPMGLIESELFGHERGAFTGASQRRQGRFELAHGGTLFLDEIGDMPQAAQAKLLRVLEDGEVTRVGGEAPIKVDVRVIAATNADLATRIRDGRFRSDLYYRLCVVPFMLPPLRDRPDDISLLARHFLECYRVKFTRSHLAFDEASMQRLVRYSWPGNVRELQNAIERAVLLARSHIVTIDEQVLLPRSDFIDNIETSHVGACAEMPLNLQQAERTHILRVLELTHWRIHGAGGAAAHLGLHPSTLRSRMKKLGLSRSTHFASA